MNRILYIEDDKSESEIIRRLYEMVRKKFHGEVQFETAESWPTGLVKIEDTRPDVVLLDLSLPPGFTTTDTLNAFAKNVDTMPPTMILTGNKFDLDLRRKCLLMGAEDFVLKDQAHRDPELLCERIYHCYLRRLSRNVHRT